MRFNFRTICTRKPSTSIRNGSIHVMIVGSHFMFHALWETTHTSSMAQNKYKSTCAREEQTQCKTISKKLKFLNSSVRF
ncbi:unnamed protein product [Brassica oleracea]